MKKYIKNKFENVSLDKKIRYSYLIFIIPLTVFILFCLLWIWNSNKTYESMINSAVKAGEFSLDFKKDFDYETYLVVVENKTMEESDLNTMLDEAKRVVNELEGITDNKENTARLDSVNKYLNNLDTYISRIEDNLNEGDKYKDNLDIWENDVQIVTSLIRESILQYIYQEITELQTARDDYQRTFINMMIIAVVAFVFIGVLIVVLSIYISKSISSPVKELNRITNQVAKGDLSVRSNLTVGAELGELSESMNLMIDKINELLEQVTNEQIRLRKAEFELLQSQINPHFLYNTLDTIVWLAEAGEEKEVVSMVENLSDFFRISLSKGNDVISIRDEIQHVRSYLEIQQVRYRDILTFDIDVPENMMDMRIPKISVQPLVENALYHGIKNKRGVGKIEIKGEKKFDKITISVKDNGIGMTTEDLERVRNGMVFGQSEDNNVFGLYNVNERIRLKFGEKSGVSIESEYNVGTVAEIVLTN